MYKPYVPNERVVDRAVELWKRTLLQAPTFDNGAHDLPNMFASVLATGLANKSKATPEQLEAFGEKLKYFLMNELSLEEIKGEPEPENCYKSLHNSVGVDYHPDTVLSAAANAAGISTNLFPWKTNMSINVDYVAFGVGYCAPWDYHYPLKNGRWLITRLSGEDINKVIDYVEGETPAFTVEAPPSLALVVAE